MIVECELDYCLYTCRHIDDIWLAERKAQIEHWDPVTHAIALWQQPGPKYACLNDESPRKPVMVGGVNLIRKGLGITWMAGTPFWQDHALEIARRSRKVLRLLMDEHGVHRIQMTTCHQGERVQKWIKLLGLDFESVMPCFGIHGETFFCYAATSRGGGV